MALSRGECLLANIRKSRGLTQEDLSADLLKQTGTVMSAVMISQFENNKRLMSPEQMRSVCIVLNCCESELYDWIY